MARIITKLHEAWVNSCELVKFVSRLCVICV